MISIYQLKPAFQNLLRPLSNCLITAGVTPNTVTVFTCVLSVVFAGFLFAHPQKHLWVWLVPLFMFARMALNAIDGMMAKEHQLQSPLGCLLNEITDVIADVALLLALASWQHVAAPLLVVLVFLAVLTEVVGMSVVQLGVARRYDGPMGKSDRAFAFSILIMLLALELLTENVVTVILLCISGLLILTCVNRALRGLQEQRTQHLHENSHQQLPSILAP